MKYAPLLIVAIVGVSALFIQGITGAVPNQRTYAESICGDADLQPVTDQSTYYGTGKRIIITCVPKDLTIATDRQTFRPEINRKRSRTSAFSEQYGYPGDYGG